MKPIDPNPPIDPSNRPNPLDPKQKADKASAPFRLGPAGPTSEAGPPISPADQPQFDRARAVVEAAGGVGADRATLVVALVRDQLTQEYGPNVDQKMIDHVARTAMDDPHLDTVLQSLLNAVQRSAGSSGESRSSS